MSTSSNGQKNGSEGEDSNMLAQVSDGIYQSTTCSNRKDEGRKMMRRVPRPVTPLTLITLLGYLLAIFFTSALGYLYGSGVGTGIGPHLPILASPLVAVTEVSASPQPCSMPFQPKAKCKGGKIVTLDGGIRRRPSSFYLQLCNWNHRLPLGSKSQNESSIIYDTLGLYKIIPSQAPMNIHIWNQHEWKTMKDRLEECLPPTQDGPCQITRHTSKSTEGFCPHSAYPTSLMRLCLDHSYRMYSLEVGPYAPLDRLESLIFQRTIEEFVPDPSVLNLLVSNTSFHDVFVPYTP